MEKYRRWTDEATGINPFIKSKESTLKISVILKSLIISVIKLHIILLLLLPIMLSIVLQKQLEKIPLIQDIYKMPLKILCILLGLYNIDDINFKKWVQNHSKQNYIILSNHVTIIDAFYYMAIIKSVKFVVSHAEQERFQAIGGLKAMVAVLTKKQPFFTLTPKNNSVGFKSLIQGELKNGYNCVVFYEGIRTNGLGTIKISTKLSKQLYKLQKDYCMVHLKYTSAPQNIFSTVNSPLYLFFVALGSLMITLKVRSSTIIMNSYNSDTDIQKDIDTFLIANASKLLNTSPSSYYTFIDFYHKTQNKQYVPVTVEDINKKQ